MTCSTTVQAITTATPTRPGLLDRLLAAFAAPAIRDMPPAVAREILESEEARAQRELREAWHRFMPLRSL
jgi:hypothetical protein